MTPSQNSPQPSQNDENSTVQIGIVYPSQPVTENPARQNNEQQIVLTAVSECSAESSQEGEPSPNALVQAGLYDGESQEYFTQKSADDSQKSATTSQPVNASQSASRAVCGLCGRTVGSVSQPVGSQAESEPVATQVESQGEVPVEQIVPQKLASQ